MPSQEKSNPTLDPWRQIFLTLSRSLFDAESISSCDPLEIHHSWFWELEPSKQEVQLFSNLPLDIVRILFQTTMEEQPPPTQLLLVSREVKRWVEPHLYRHVHLLNDRQIHLFYRTFFKRWRIKSQSAGDAAIPSPRHIQSLVVYCTSFDPVPISMMKEMCGLQDLTFWAKYSWEERQVMAMLVGACHSQSDLATSRSIGSVQEADPFTFCHLRRLSFHARAVGYCLGSSLGSDRLSFAHRIFRDITHLDLYYSVQPQWEDLRCLQNLTHLALDMVAHPTYSMPEIKLERLITRLLEACPSNLTVFIIGCINHRNKDYDALDFQRQHLSHQWSNIGEPDAENSRLPGWLITQSNDYRHINVEKLQFLSRLTLGKVDPRVVVGSAVDLPAGHTFRNCVVYLTYREDGWDPRSRGHSGDCWDAAEGIIQSRIP